MEQETEDVLLADLTPPPPTNQHTALLLLLLLLLPCHLLSSS
jgi:hypothetical protein